MDRNTPLVVASVIVGFFALAISGEDQGNIFLVGNLWLMVAVIIVAVRINMER